MVQPRPCQSILAVTSEIPWPLDTGGHLRTFHLLRGLAHQARVRLVTPVGPGEEAARAALEQHGIALLPVPCRPRTALTEGWRIARAALRREPYVMYRRHYRRSVRQALLRALQHEPADLLYLDHLDSWPYGSVAANLPVVLDLHNVYSTLARRVADERSIPASLYLRHEAALLERVERRAATGPTAVFTVSEADRLHFAALGARQAVVVPNGVDCAAFAHLPVGRLAGPPHILYLGALSWGPNIAAARTLATEILPVVRQSVPETRLCLVGKNPTDEVRALARLDHVEVMGSVPNIIPYLTQATLMALPLQAGGGTRLKILEAFAAGLPVISTAIGCEGLDVRADQHLIMADQANFATQIVALLRDRLAGARLAAQARTLVARQYDWEQIAQHAGREIDRAFARCHFAVEVP